MRQPRRQNRVLIAALCCLICLICLSAAGAAVKPIKPADPLEPARTALRTLQFNKALELLTAAAGAGNTDAQYLLGLMYLNGVGILADPGHGRKLLQSAAEHGQGADAFVLEAELAHQPDAR